MENLVIMTNEEYLTHAKEKLSIMESVDSRKRKSNEMACLKILIEILEICKKKLGQL